MTQQTEEHAVTSVELDATPDQVWHALTTPEGLARWMGDDASMGDTAGEDLLLDDPVTGERKRGRVDEVLPGQRLRYRWWPEIDPEQATDVAITLVPCVSGTRVTVVESRPLPSVTAQAELRASSVAMSGADWQWRAALLSVTMRHNTLSLSPR